MEIVNKIVELGFVNFEICNFLALNPLHIFCNFKEHELSYTIETKKQISQETVIE